MDGTNKKKAGWKQKIFHELIEYWSIVIYLAIFFGVFTNYRRLILAHYHISYEAYGFSVIKALVLSKVILVAESLRLGRGFEERPLIVPTLYKAFLFTVCVALFNFVESMIRSFIGGSGPIGAVNEFMSRLDDELFAGGLVVFSAFIPFFAVRELGRVLGEGKIRALFFRSRVTASAENLEQTKEA